MADEEPMDGDRPMTLDESWDALEAEVLRLKAERDVLKAENERLTAGWATAQKELEDTEDMYLDARDAKEQGEAHVATLEAVLREYQEDHNCARGTYPGVCDCPVCKQARAALAGGEGTDR
jgi:chromosome segregation ATPase